MKKVFTLLIVLVVLIVFFDVMRAPDMLERVSEYLEWIRKAEILGLGTLLVIVAIGMIIAAFCSSPKRGYWTLFLVFLVLFYVWFVGPETIQAMRDNTKKELSGGATSSSQQNLLAVPPCTHIAELPARKKGDYCIEMAKGGTVVVEPPPYTVAEVIPSDRVRVAFTDWKDNLMQKGGVVDPGADQWVCIPDGTKTVRVTALTDTGLRVRIGLKPITAHNCW